ncbi:MAG: peptidyl-dipeptidase Dcp [Candidatus Aminicenantes bacterium]|nr:peptidyl-dipeptidase Dcp [Candidatus Aminicenantes bacterium]
MRNMKAVFLILAVVVLFWSFSCSKKEEPKPAAAVETNPFFTEWTAPFGTPPFPGIKEAHYMPAFQEGIARQKKEVEVIAASTEAPTFANTIEAVERTGELLTKVNNVFYALTDNNTNEELQKIEAEIAPLLAKHRDDISLNDRLFQRVKAVWEGRSALSLTPEQAKLLEKTYKEFVRNGAALDESKKAELRAINEELAVLTVKFGENVLKEDNGFSLVLESPGDLAGLPADVVTAAAEAAKAKGLEGKWVFTLHKPSCIPFFQYSARRDLREKLFRAFISRGDNGNELDNKAVLTKISVLRVKRANLLGYKTHADYVLEENMAKTPAGVYKLLNQLWGPSLDMAKTEAKELQALVDKEGGSFKLEPWDWWYYAEKLKKAKYDLDDEILRPYFELKAVRQGAFDVAGKLFGLRFEPRADIPVYHPDVEVFEVKEADGTHVGILYTDYFPRPSKRGGAWSGSIREQCVRDGRKVTPINFNVGNFTKPTAEKPSLITFEEAQTMFHELGHALHDLLSNVTYESLAGTNVPRDFVELASQIMENWAGDPEVIKTYARHYQTGDPIPQELVDKIKKAGLFNQGFATVEYMAACYLDMDWHTLAEAVEPDAVAFENAAMQKIGLIPEIVVRYRSPYFSHIFSGGYSSGYYSYIWSEVLDADAFQAFKETSLFDPATARSFRENVLARGGTEDAMELFKRFRGREPKVEPLLKRKGFLN